MPRVIKEAPIVEKQVVCDGCGRTIAYVKNDVKVFSSCDYLGDSNPDRYYLICPADDCSNKIWVKNK